MATCADCGKVYDASADLGTGAEGRTPCPGCGSTARQQTRVLAEDLTTTDAVSVDVMRGVNEVRAAVLFVLLSVSIGVGVTAGFEENSPLIGVAYGALAFLVVMVLVSLVYRWAWLQHRVMTLMHWVTGR
jgi:hypothetical protein